MIFFLCCNLNWSHFLSVLHLFQVQFVTSYISQEDFHFLHRAMCVQMAELLLAYGYWIITRDEKRYSFSAGHMVPANLSDGRLDGETENYFSATAWLEAKQQRVMTLQSVVHTARLCESMVCRFFALLPFGGQIGISASCRTRFLPGCLLDASAGEWVHSRTLLLIVCVRHNTTGLPPRLQSQLQLQKSTTTNAQR